MQQSTIKKVIYFLLALAPLTLWTVSDGKLFDIFPTNSQGLFFPFISGKNLLFRLIVDIAFVSWLFLINEDKTYKLQKTPISLAIGLFALVLAVADLFGVDSMASFFSGFERMEGFVGLIHYVMYFTVITSVASTKHDWKEIAKWFLFSNALVGLYAFFQLLGSQSFIVYKYFPGFASFFARVFPIHQGGRLDSTLGNPAYFAIFCVYFAFLAMYGVAVSKLNKSKALYSAVFLINIFLLLFTATRSAVLGLIAGLVLAGSVFLFDKKKFKYEWFGIIALLILFGVSLFIAKNLLLPVFYCMLGLVVVTATKSFVISKESSKKIVAALFIFIVALITLFTVMRKSDFATKTPFLNRFSTISVSDPTGNSRVMIWKMSIEGFKERPVLGWGQDNFPYVFAKYYDPNMYAQEPWFDRSHNVFFDWLIAGGILGLLAHLSLYFFGFLLTHKTKAFSHTEKSIIYGMLVAQFINNLFIFDNLASYILFFTMLAYISSIYALENASKSSISLEKYKSWIVPIGGIGAVVLCFYSVILPYYANKAAIRGMMDYRGDILDVMRTKREGFESALSLGYVGQREIKEQTVSTGVSVLQVNGQGLDPQKASEVLEEKNKWLKLINGLADEDMKNSPDDLRVLELYGEFYLRLGATERAEKILLSAHKLAPHRQKTSFSLMQYYLLKGDIQNAYVLSKQTYELAPPYDLARKAYTSVALRVGVKEFADAVNEVHKDGLILVYPGSLKQELIGVKDKKLTDAFVQALIKDYPEKTSDIAKEYKELLSQK